MAVLNAMLGLVTIVLGLAFGYVLHITRNLRKAAILNLPPLWQRNLPTLFYGLWCVVALMLVGGTTRLIYAHSGSTGLTAVIFTAVVTALSAAACFYVLRASFALRKG